MINHISKSIMEYMMATKRNIDIMSIVYRASIMLALLIAASAIGYVFLAVGLLETDIAIVYLLAVWLMARFADGYVFSFLASLLAAFFFNFLFVEPYFTFSVNAHRYVITFIIMTIAALVTSTLNTHSKQNAMEAREKEAGTKILYTMTNHLTDAADIHDIARLATGAISKMLNSNVGCLCFDENGKPEQTFIQQVSPQKQICREMPDVNALLQQIEGLKTGCHIGTEFYDWPIDGRETMLGIIRIPKKRQKL
ncbi:MAG: kdpD 2 [Caproiciproducens sp.]|nr:kdpD 2 [Caproiciproducens sp.]